MRVAIFGDIHGNATALEAVREDMNQQGVDQKICLGDIAFRGPQPREALATVFGMDLDGLIVGNTDQWLFRGFPEGFAPGEEKLRALSAFLAWAHATIDPADLPHLRALPESHTFRAGGHSIAVVHASPGSTEAWFDAGWDDERLAPIFTGAGACDVLVYGHIHTPFVRRINRRWLVNTGSVGNPIDGDYRASYVVFTVENGGFDIELRRVSYDVGQVGRVAREREFPFAERYEESLRTGSAV